MFVGYEDLRVDFSFLASEYHAGIVSGLSLIAHNLDEWISAGEPVCLHLLISPFQTNFFFCSHQSAKEAVCLHLTRKDT